MDDICEYGDLTVKELKEECRKRELKVGGYKKDLVKRLEDDDNVFKKTGRMSRQTWEGMKSAWEDVATGWREGKKR